MVMWDRRFDQITLIRNNEEKRKNNTKKQEKEELKEIIKLDIELLEMRHRAHLKHIECLYELRKIERKKFNWMMIVIIIITTIITYLFKLEVDTIVKQQFIIPYFIAIITVLAPSYFIQKSYEKMIYEIILEFNEEEEDQS